MFASKATKVVELSEGPAVIRKLSWRSLDKAGDEPRRKMLGTIKDLGAEAIREFEASYQSLAAERAEKRKDPQVLRAERYSAYDPYVILHAGVVSLPGVDKLTPDLIDDLSPATAKVLHEGIVDFTLGPVEEAERDEVEGKGSGPSTSS